MKEKIEKLLAEGKEEQAIEILEKYVKENQEEEMLLILGELYYRKARNSDALNMFNAVLRLNPEHQKAKNYVTMINNVLDYYCKDLLNP